MRETSEYYAIAFKEAIPAEGLNQVRFIATDDPSPHMWTTLSAFLPRLEMLCLDTVHLPIVYEYSTWHRKTSGSRVLRLVMSKFAAYSPDFPATTWGAGYTGHEDRPLTREENIFREKIPNMSMSPGAVSNIYLDLSLAITHVNELVRLFCIAFRWYGY